MEHRAWLLIKFMFAVRRICIHDRAWWWTTALQLASTWSHAHQAPLQLGARFLRLHFCFILTQIGLFWQYSQECVHILRHRYHQVSCFALTTWKEHERTTLNGNPLWFSTIISCPIRVKDYAFLAQMEAGSSAEMIFDFLIEARHPCGTTSTTDSQLGQVTLETRVLCYLLHLIVIFWAQFWCTNLY